MSLFSKAMSLLPLTVGSSGHKHDMLIRLGRIFHLGRPAKSCYGKVVFATGQHPVAVIVAHAPANFYRYFPASPLGLWLMTALRPGQTFVDIGANLGGYSLLARSRGAHVFAFEPVPSLALFLRENEHAFGNVQGVALSDGIGEVRFFLGKNLEGSNLVPGLSAPDQSGYVGTTSVRCTTFDAFFAREIAAGHPFHLVKIDVEGHEAAVVHGMREALSRKLVHGLWCEVRGPRSDRNPNSYAVVCALMEGHGYACYRSDGLHFTPFDFENVAPGSLPQFFDLAFTAEPIRG